MRITKAMRRRLILLASVGLSFSVGLPSLRAQQAFFMGLGTLGPNPGQTSPSSSAFGVPDDGRVVYGITSSPQGNQVFRWTKEAGMVGLGFYGSPWGVSGDGLTVVGGFVDGNTSFYWSKNAELTTFSGGVLQGVSFDGSVAVGRGPQGASRWTPSGGWQPLNLAPITGDSSFARGVSRDGSVIIGHISRGGTQESWAWTAQTGAVELTTPQGYRASQATRTSDDGSTIIGFLFEPGSTTAADAARWTTTNGWVGLGDLPGGGFNSRARAVSADGSIVVGHSDVGGLGTGNETFIWDAAHGMRKLLSVLVDDLHLSSAASWLRLSGDPGWTMSADGRTIVGFGANPQGLGEAWIASLGTAVPEPNGLIVAALVVATLVARRRRRARSTTRVFPSL